MLQKLFPIAALALASLGLLACAEAPMTGSTTAASKVPVVLVHGAWSNASAWDRVAADLRGRGYTVTAVNLPGHGADSTPPETLSLAGYADAVRAALPANGKAVLVGHSMAGMVISQVAEQAPERLQGLVFVAAYLPASGQSLYQLSQTDADSRVGKHWRQDNPQAYTPASIAPEGVVEVFCADCSTADQQLVRAGQKPEAIPPLGTPVTLSAQRFGSVPRVYVHTTRDNAVSYALQQRMLAAAGGARRVVTLETSHMPMLTQPRAVADAIEAAAR
jgi:pimeloyl-ACP methyl ester carboxylesterase